MVTGSGSTAIHQLFSYDASGSVVSVDYSSDGGSTFTTYYYLRNAQNDVISLIDSTGATVVQYTYDSWGKLIATTGTLTTTLGANNPFRYRGYVYDVETGWYYLQSRCYDPTTCRFISADVLLSTGQGVLGHNAYAYCLNNPVNMSDRGGSRPNFLVTMTDSGGGTKSEPQYISDQNDASIASLPFGKNGTVGNNGCGMVALYNALVAAGYDVEFEELNDAFSDCFGLHLADGKLGMNPVSMYGALCGAFGIQNVQCNALSGKDKGYDVVIGLYVWRSNSGEIGAHYFAAVADSNGNYTVYNDSGIIGGTWESLVSNTDAAGWVLCSWGITFS